MDSFVYCLCYNSDNVIAPHSPIQAAEYITITITSNYPNAPLFVFSHHEALQFIRVMPLGVFDHCMSSSSCYLPKDWFGRFLYPLYALQIFVVTSFGFGCLFSKACLHRAFQMNQHVSKLMVYLSSRSHLIRIGFYSSLLQPIFDCEFA